MASVGLDAKLYYGTAGTTPDTETDEMKNIRDLTWNDERGEADISSRGSEFELVIPAMRKMSIEWEMLANDDTDHAAMKTAYGARTPVAMLIIDEGGEGVDADWIIIKMTQAQPLNGTNVVSVTAKPTYVTRAPAAYPAEE